MTDWVLWWGVIFFWLVAECAFIQLTRWWAKKEATGLVGKIWVIRHVEHDFDRCMTYWFVGSVGQAGQSSQTDWIRIDIPAEDPNYKRYVFLGVGDFISFDPNTSVNQRRIFSTGSVTDYLTPHYISW